MTVVKTIEQQGNTYRINRIGNATYKIEYTDTDGNVKHVQPTFNSLQSAEEMVKSFETMDKAISTFDQKAYVQQYQKENLKVFRFKVNRKTQPEIIAHLESIDNVQGYIIGLIREDMNK